MVAILVASNAYYFGRQPIVGRGGELVAYECLFRSGPDNRASVIDDVAATATVIKHAFLDLGIDAALGDKTGFINISEDMLMSDVVELLPPHRVVLELLETVRVTPAVIARARQLSAAGYRIALDDVTAYDESLAALLPFADFVKIDIRDMAPAAIAGLAAILRPLVKTLLAEKVETEAEFVHCRELGFDLFQGYFFARPTMLTGRAIQPAELSLIKLLAALIAGATCDELEDIIKRLPDFSLRLMTLSNTAALRRIHRVTTLRHAIIVLGRNQIRRLVNIVLFARGSDLPAGANPLLQTASARGRLMELIAGAYCDREVLRHAFMVGLLSYADALFDQPLDRILDAIQPEESWIAALLHRQGELGLLLNIAEAADGADGAQLVDALAAVGMHDLDRFARAQVEALRWAGSF